MSYRDEDAIALAEEKLAEMATALRRYGRHFVGCPEWIDPETGVTEDQRRGYVWRDCTCGFKATFREAELVPQA